MAPPLANTAASVSQQATQVFFPAAGYRDCFDGGAYARGDFSGYWSSESDELEASYLIIDDSLVFSYNNYRARGFFVRCIRE